MYNTKADIWAFGCIAYELCTKEKAFQNDWELNQYGHVEESGSKDIFDEEKWPRGHAALFARNLGDICVNNTIQFSWTRRPSARKIQNALCILKAK